MGDPWNILSGCMMDKPMVDAHCNVEISVMMSYY